ncbi:hypothetical protein [Azospirillum argentinense]|uniref:Uncharacterized protein n=1 Tax=Azospirillum brasilense TaxID=192 RepID=A0A4D8Q2B6_AZOBR|nr:hypothetical protein [Azospirillum argentinense]MBK3798917.1 hypothetical protein [Azospirillum argentinense]QCO04305.1 hypothetical protein D3867_20390 [Azospirillum argentinense]
MPLKTIRLELARTADHPEGSAEHGYEFTAPLTSDGHLDLEEWRDRKAVCTVRRFWRGEDEQTGHLVHRGKGWLFDYDADDSDDDEPIFRFDRHTLVEGEYISITEHDGVQRPFRIVSVR